jgi:hypothetical protein
MFRIIARVLAVGLLSLPAATFAFEGTVYPLTGLPDIYVDNLTSTYNGTNLKLGGNSVYLPLPGPPSLGTPLSGGAVEAISDVSGTWCFPSPGSPPLGNYESPCKLGGLALAFNADATGFTITGQSIADYNAGTNGTVTYLAGTYLSGTYQDPGGANEYGELFEVTSDNVSELNQLEQTFASSVGTKPATNWDWQIVAFNFNSDTGDGDMEEFVPAPEPATLTLLCTGLAAGLLRKRLARKKA